MEEELKKITNLDSVLGAVQFFNELVASTPHTVSQITSRRRDAPFVNTREYIAKEMRRAGYSYGLIGHVMNRDHSSICYLVNKRHL
jgi:hypothetical protein